MASAASRGREGFAHDALEFGDALPIAVVVEEAPGSPGRTLSDASGLGLAHIAIDARRDRVDPIGEKAAQAAAPSRLKAASVLRRFVVPRSCCCSRQCGILPKTPAFGNHGTATDRRRTRATACRRAGAQRQRSHALSISRRSMTTVEVADGRLDLERRALPLSGRLQAERTIYHWCGTNFEPVSRYSALDKLVPTEWGPPTFEIDGIKMLPTARFALCGRRAQGRFDRAARQSDPGHLRWTRLFRGVVPAGAGRTEFCPTKRIPTCCGCAA
jgi:hypothetical protein